MSGAPSEQARRVARYYDRQTGPFYRSLWDPVDLHFGLFEAGDPSRSAALKRMTRAVVGPLPLGPEDQVLDAGCGVGGTALDLARWTGCRVLGVTLSEVQLRIATERAAEAGLAHRVRFALGDCTRHLPVADGALDAVVCIEAACHFGDRRGFFAECRRALRPGGLLALSDWLAVDGITPADRQHFITPLCAAWSLAPDLETLGSYQALCAGADLEVLEAQDLGEAVLDNARMMQEGLLSLMLAEAARDRLPEDAQSWKAQYRTLASAWMARRFTIGRLLVSKRQPGTTGA